MLYASEGGPLKLSRGQPPLDGCGGLVSTQHIGEVLSCTLPFFVTEPGLMHWPG